MEVQVEPLRDIQLILVVAEGNGLDQVVCLLAHSGNDVTATDRLKVEVTVSKW